MDFHALFEELQETIPPKVTLNKISVVAGPHQLLKVTEVNDPNHRQPNKLARTRIIFRYGLHDKFEALKQATAEGLDLNELLYYFQSEFELGTYTSESGRVYMSHVHLTSWRNNTIKRKKTRYRDVLLTSPKCPKPSRQGWLEIHLELIPTRKWDRTELLLTLKKKENKIFQFINDKI